MQVHRDAAVGFGEHAAAYAVGRPSYPDEAIAYLKGRLSLDERSRVIDVGAGTGKLTELLVETRIIGVEPVGGMREEFSSRLRVPLVAGVAEQLPVGPNCVDAVVCGQAFHWFDPSAAANEFARVLRRGGGIALLWNRRDSSVDFVGELERAMRWAELSHHRSDVHYPSLLDALAALHDAQSERFYYLDRLSHEDLLARISTISYIASMDLAGRKALLAHVGRLVSTLPNPVELPCLTEVVTAKRR